MIAYKFLAAGGLGLYSGVRWPLPAGGKPGGWITAEGELTLCCNGVHACTTGALVDWIDDELWVVELAGDVIEREGLILARSARLIRPVRRWSPAAARALAETCVLRVRDHGVRALVRVGRSADAGTLGGLHRLTQLGAYGATAAEDSSPQILAYLADAVRLAQGGRPDGETAGGRSAPKPSPGAIAANVAYVAAVADAGEVAGGPQAFTAGFEAERSWQRAWLAARLGLD